MIEEKAPNVTDGFHYARWIVPLVGAFFGVACFLPLALSVHPLFWIGVAPAVSPRVASLLDLDELAKFILAVLLIRLEREVFSPWQALLERLAAVSQWSVDDLALVA